jgi:predicted DsbA family dithiol-disulfide isomerase
MVGAAVLRVKGTSKAPGHGRKAAMQVDVFSDTICPWCFVGKRRFERALSIRPQSGLRVRWRAFQLNPAMPAEGMERQAYLEAKFGGGDRARSLYDTVRTAGSGESIEFRFDLIKRTPSTLLSHRLLRRAMAQGQQDTLLELIFRGYFQEGQDIGNMEVLAEMADAVGMGEQSTLEYLEGKDDADAIIAEDTVARRAGINGVPCFIFNGKFALSGAQEPEAFLQMFDLAREHETMEAEQAASA